MTAVPTATAVDQVLVTAAAGDAITNLARSLRPVFERIGPSRVFARNIDPALAGEVIPLDAYPDRAGRRVIVFHASIGEPIVHRFLQERPEPIVLVYHNITPAEHFAPWDPTFAALLAEGREEVGALRGRVARAVADSPFNARELATMGYDDVVVVPPALDGRRLHAIEPSPAALARARTVPAPLVLSVAQLLPHKRPDFLVEAVHVARTYLGFPGTLCLVGHQRLAPYRRAVRRQISELGVVSVDLTGPVDDDFLAALYRTADVVVSASEHEGFCLPLIEAMSFGVPVVARAFAAVPETVGDAGILLPPGRGPAFMAEVLAELLSDTALQEDLARRGRDRVVDLWGRDHDRTLLAIVRGVAS